MYRPSQDSYLTRDRILYSPIDSKQAADTDSSHQLELGKHWRITKVDLWKYPMSFPDLETHYLSEPAWLEIWIRMWKWFKSSRNLKSLWVKTFLRSLHPLQIDRQQLLGFINNTLLINLYFLLTLVVFISIYLYINIIINEHDQCSLIQNPCDSFTSDLSVEVEEQHDDQYVHPDALTVPPRAEESSPVTARRAL